MPSDPSGFRHISWNFGDDCPPAKPIDLVPYQPDRGDDLGFFSLSDLEPHDPFKVPRRRSAITTTKPTIKLTKIHLGARVRRGRERRPACNQRTRGSSRRSPSRARSGDPPDESDSAGLSPLSVGGAGR